MLLNCTNHVITIVRLDGRVDALPPSGIALRVDPSTDAQVPAEPEGSIPVFEHESVLRGKLVGAEFLPSATHAIVVSQIVGEFLRANSPPEGKLRVRVLCPATHRGAVRDVSGALVGVTHLLDFGRHWLL